MKWAAAYVLAVSLLANAQTFKRLGACPLLGCVFPPNQANFLPGALFDIRLEVHAPVNGSEAAHDGVPDSEFSFCIQKGEGKCVNAAKFFNVHEPALEKWTFSYFEDLFARDAKQSSVVNVASKAYRAVTLHEPGAYTATLTYYNTSKTVAHWTVREPARERKAKNVLFFIGDGMTQPMITAARLLAHKSINGVYQSLMQMDTMDNLGHQMPHSLDSFITDSANSATALYSGHKASVNALNVYADSSASSSDDPKVETIAELFRRRIGGPIGMVSTAFIADATPAALCSHTRNRDDYALIVSEYLFNSHGLNGTLAWPTGCSGPDVIFGGGAEQFIPGPGSPNGTDLYKVYQANGYNVVYNKTQLSSIDTSKKTLGIFSISNMAKWLDREVYPETLKNMKNSPTGDGTAAIDQPGLVDMTLKAIDILQARSKAKNNKEGTGWFLMTEAASIDKMMHVLDYDRALAELLELDNTIRTTIEHLKKIGEYENTLIVVTADHGHGFDVFGSVDTEYLQAATTDRQKRDAIGTYQNSGLSSYTVAKGSLPLNDTAVHGAQGPNFPVTWDPRYTYAAGFAANPDHREGYAVNETGIRLPAVASGEVNPADQPAGFIINGTLPVSSTQGVHSLQDVSVFANGPGSQAFRGVYNNIDIFFKIADALALGRTSEN